MAIHACSRLDAELCAVSPCSYIRHFEPTREVVAGVSIHTGPCMVSLGSKPLCLHGPAPLRIGPGQPLYCTSLVHLGASQSQSKTS